MISKISLFWKEGLRELAGSNRMTILMNRPLFKERRRQLRKDQTDSENCLWRYLRNKQMAGHKFFRQYGVGPYILDFYCPKSRLAIELDGSQHLEADQKKYDEERTKYLGTLSIRVIRFWSNDVLRNTAGVLEEILAAVGSNSSPPPLSKRGGV